MDIEVNEYVRTKNKGIRKIDRIDNNKTINKYLYFTGKEDFEGKEYGIIKTTDIVKHSKQLIYLIENKDILKVRIDKTIMFFGIDEGTSDIKYKEIIKSIENGEYELLEILTHQQFESNCYKVGGRE